jgi:amidase
MSTELWRKSATELAQLIRQKKVSSREVVQAHLDRIDAVNDFTRAITVVLAESALEAADQADKAVSVGLKLGPLHGVPITIKENIDLQGIATTDGIVDLKDLIAPSDAPHIAQIKEAGAIPLARTNTPDFAMRWHTDNDLHGATRNPWDANRTAGGSSGGEAVALATGMSPLGFGNDLGGSLRLPSQFNGTAAIKPSFGRVPKYSSTSTSESSLAIQMFSVQGPMARHVRDLRLALNNSSAADNRDPWWVPAPLVPNSTKQRLRVALTLDPAGQGIDPQVAEGVRRAAKVLSSVGYEIEEVDPPSVAELTLVWRNLVINEMRHYSLEAMKPMLSKDAAHFLDLAMETAAVFNMPDFIAAWAKRTAYARAWSQFFERYDLILGPVSTQRPPEVGFDLESAERVFSFTKSLSLIVCCNILGLPAAVVPVGTSEGLPQAVQIIGPRFHEATCLDAAEMIEQSLGLVTPIDPRA